MACSVRVYVNDPNNLFEDSSHDELVHELKKKINRDIKVRKQEGKFCYHTFCVCKRFVKMRVMWWLQKESSHPSGANVPPRRYAEATPYFVGSRKPPRPPIRPWLLC